MFPSFFSLYVQLGFTAPVRTGMVAITIYTLDCFWLDRAVLFAVVVAATLETAAVTQTVCSNMSVFATTQTLDHLDFDVLLNRMIKIVKE